MPSRTENLGRLLSLAPLLSDDDIADVLARVQAATQRTLQKTGGGVVRFQDPAQLTDMVVCGGLLSHVCPAPGAPAPAKDSTAALGSPTTADAEHSAMVRFCFGGASGEDPGGDVADDDDEYGSARKQTVTETDALMDSRFAGAYEDLKARGIGAYRQGRRKTVSSEVINLEDIDQYNPPMNPKTKDDAAFLRSVLREEYLFEHLEDFELDVLVQAMFKQDLHKGASVFVEGEMGDTYKILQEGTAQITETHQDGKGHYVVDNVGAGWKRGEEDLMYAAESQQTVTITSDKARVWCLQRQPYRFIVTKASIKKRAMYEEFLSKISFLKGMNGFARLQVADALKPVLFHQGEQLISFGDEGKYFFIICEGTVKVVGREGDSADDPHKDVCEFGVGDCVGELEFVHGHRCVADVIAATPIVRCAKMGKRHFEKVMGPVEDVLKQRAAEDTKFAYYRGTGVATPL